MNSTAICIKQNIGLLYTALMRRISRNPIERSLSLETGYRRKIAGQQVYFAAQTRTYRVSYRTTCQKIYSVGIGITLEFSYGTRKIGPG